MKSPLFTAVPVAMILFGLAIGFIHPTAGMLIIATVLVAALALLVVRIRML